MAGTGLEALYEGDLLGEHGLLALELRLLLDVGQRALLAVELVVAGIGGQRAAVDLDDLADDAVHELAVVRGHQDGAVIALQEGLQPDQALDVEMVRRLVEQHRVRAHQEDLGQRDAHLPAARQLADVARHRLLAEAKPVEHLAGAAVECVAVELVELCLHLAVSFDDGIHLVGAIGIAHGRLELGHLDRESRHRSDAVHHFGHGAASCHVADVLAEIADPHTAIDGDLTFVGLLLAGDHAEKRGLAGAVRPDQSDLLAALDRGRGLDEDDLLAVLLGNGVEADHTGREPLRKSRTRGVAAAAGSAC